MAVSRRPCNEVLARHGGVKRADGVTCVLSDPELFRSLTTRCRPSMTVSTTRAWLLSLWLLTALGAASLAWRECVVAAATLVLSHRLFLWQTDLGAPWEGLRLGVRCVSFGLFGLLMSLALAIVAASGLLDLLAMTHRNASPAILAVTVAGAFVVVLPAHALRRGEELVFAGALVVLTVLAYAAADAGWRAIPCALTLSMAIYLARVNWRLTRAGVETFLPCGPR